MTRLNQVAVNDSSQSHFNKISNHLLDEPSFFRVCTQINEFFFASVMITVGANFLFWLCLQVLLCYNLRIRCST